MGWWSATIMGGDTPLDARDTVLFDILDIDSDDFFEDKYTPAKIKDLLMENLDSVQAYNWDSWYEGLHYQVLGVMVMEYGLSTADDRVKSILSDARDAAVSDSWASDSTEREGYIHAFINQIDAYDGTPTEIASEGLFEVLGNAMASGSKGLINKNI